MAPSSPYDPTIRPPHPLAQRAIERLGSGGYRVLDFGTGSGRNAVALRAAGFEVTIIDDATAASVPTYEESDVAAAIATHAMLHGTPASIGARLRWLAEALRRDGSLYATFGSTRDRRFGRGCRIGPHTFASDSDDEAGVAHTYFTSEELCGVLQRDFVIETLEEVLVDAIAGRWAHAATPLQGAVHWFAVARRREVGRVQ